MVAPFECHEAAAPRVLARGLERPFVRLCAAVREIDYRQRVRHHAREQLSQSHLRLEDVLAVYHRVEVTLRLPADRLHDGWVSVADVIHPDSGEEIDIT